MFSFAELRESKDALVMGILNITPDSFSDGGEAFSPDSVIEKVNELINDGADIIDVGACSTAPNNTIISEEEELKRLNKELATVEKMLAQDEGKLNNAGFMAKAPQAVVEQEKAKLENANNKKAKILESLEALN